MLSARPGGRFAGGFIAALWFCSWLGSVTVQSDWIKFFGAATEAVNSCVIVIWPVTIGVETAIATYFRKSGFLDVLSAFPGLAGFRFIITECLVTVAYASAGAVLSIIVAAGCASYYGSSMSNSFVGGLAISSLGTFTFFVWGYLLGLVFPSYLTSGLALLGLYVGAWQLNSHDSLEPMGHAGVTGAVGQSFRFTDPALMGFLIAHVAAIVLGLSLLALVMSGRTMLWHQLAGFLMLLVLAAIGLVMSVAALNVQHRTHGFLGPGSASSWNCQPIGATSVACLPTDAHAFSATFVAAMSRFDATLTAELPPEQTGFLYAPDRGAYAGSIKYRHWMPMELDSTTPQPRWAQAAYSFLADNPSLVGSVSPTDEHWCAQADALGIEIFDRVLMDGGAEASEVSTFLNQLAGCRG